MSLYVDQPEGVAFYSAAAQGKFFACYTLVGGNYRECDTREDYKMTTTRIIPSGGTEDGTFNLNFQFISLGSGVTHFTMDQQLQVLDNGDRTVAFRCPDNGFFMNMKTVLQEFDGTQHHFCSEPGICESCKFYLECGSVVPINLEILDIRWGERDGDIIANPSVVSTDKSDNWSDQTVLTTLTVSYTTTKEDKTVWQRGWGFEFSASISQTCDFFFGETTFTASTTISYEGSEGGEHTVTEEQHYEESKDFPCPPHSRCQFKLITRKLDNVDMPFQATVQRNMEDGQIIQWVEEGVWYGVTAIDTWSAFCTEDLLTGESNCPPIYRTKLYPKRINK